MKPEDLPIFMEMMGELAVLLRAPEDFTTSRDDLHHALFDDPPRFEAIMVSHQGEPAGLATWFENYEVLGGKSVMWFDYFYVRPQYRGRPIAPAMLVYLLMLARDRGYPWIEGTVNEWNTEALGFYKALKAQELSQRLFRLQLSGVDWAPYESLGQTD